MAKKYFTFLLCAALACSLVFSAAGYDRETRARLILTPSEYIDRLRSCWDAAPVTAITDVGDGFGDFDFSDEIIAAKAEKYMIAKEQLNLYEYTETDPTIPSGDSGGVMPMSLVTMSNGEILDLSTAVGRCTYLSTIDNVTLRIPSFWTVSMEETQHDNVFSAIWDGIKSIGNFFANLAKYLWNLIAFAARFASTVFNALVYLVFRTGFALSELVIQLADKINALKDSGVNWSYLGASLIPINWDLLYSEGKIGSGDGKIKIPFVRSPEDYVDVVGGHRGGR